MPFRFATCFALLTSTTFAQQCTSPAPGTPPDQLPASTRPASYTQLYFHDEFTGTAVDETKWKLRRKADGNDRGAIYSYRNAEVKNGCLKLKVFTDDRGRQRIGWLQTQKVHDSTYGYLEARIKFDSRPGQWGAFWVQSRENNWSDPRDGSPNDKKSLSEREYLRKYGAEIDIVEGLRISKADRSDVANSCFAGVKSRDWHRIHPESQWGQFVDYSDIWAIALHWRGDGEKIDCGMKRPLSRQEGSIQEEWHVYGLEWTPGHYAFYLDGTLVQQTARGVSHRPEYLLLTTQIETRTDKPGRINFAGPIPSGGYGSNPSTRMRVDWVRWWKQP